MSGNVAAVVLAAGFSSRMGEFKPLLDLAGVTALERAVTTFRDAGVRDVRVVTGHRANELETLLKHLEVRAIFNPHYRNGMFASVATGVATLEEELDAFFVLPVDLPLVRPVTVRRLLVAYREKSGGIIYPAFQGERGHPPLIARRMAPEITGWSGPGGLRGALARWEEVASDVEVADEQILRDMDTPDDYRLLRERAGRLQVPTGAECRVLLGEVLRVGPRIMGHGQAVAEVAVLLGKELNRAGYHLDIPLLEAAGLLHDLARKEPDHARAGACLLREIGHGVVADLVATHMDIPVREEGPVSAGELLYLADKVVQGERRVPLSKRFQTTMERHSGEPTILECVAVRLKTALNVQGRLERVLGRSLSEVIGTI